MIMDMNHAIIDINNLDISMNVYVIGGPHCGYS